MHPQIVLFYMIIFHHAEITIEDIKEGFLYWVENWQITDTEFFDLRTILNCLVTVSFICPLQFLGRYYHTFGTWNRLLFNSWMLYNGTLLRDCSPFCKQQRTNSPTLGVSLMMIIVVHGCAFFFRVNKNLDGLWGIVVETANISLMFFHLRSTFNKIVSFLCVRVAVDSPDDTNTENLFSGLTR